MNVSSRPDLREPDNDKFTVTWNNLTLTIHPVEPAGLTATMVSPTQIDLSGFTHGAGGENTVIRRATGSYPATPQDGTEVYNSTGASTSDTTSLSANTTYYYRAWTYNTTEKLFSDDYQQDNERTNALPVNSNPSPANDADNQSLNPTLSIDVYDYDDATQNMNVSFYTNESGAWAQIGTTNTSVNSGTITKATSNFDEWGTRYWWSVNTSDGNGGWDNDTYFFDTDPDDAATASNEYPSDGASGVTTSPVCHVDIADDEGSSSITVCFYTNESGAWTLKQTNTSVSDSDTVYWTFTDADTMNTKYWWNVSVDDGTSNVTYGPWNFTTFNLAISDEYVSNESTSVYRNFGVNPANISAYCTGTGMSVYMSFFNMTPTTPTWTLLNSWSDQSSGRFEITSGHGTDWIWGNTTYYWCVNITDGNGHWVNQTFNFETNATAGGNDARMDVDNDNNVFVGDLNTIWANRNGQADFNGLYDTDEDDNVFVGDLNTVWAARS